MSGTASDSNHRFRVGPASDPDRYVLGAAVGSGAEGILYRGSITTATGVQLDVAIKMLQPRFLSRVDDWHARWTEQVELLRSLQVPGVVPVRDGFVGPLPHPPGGPGESQSLYLVMNWVDGESLDDWIRHRPSRNPIDDLKILLPVAAALDLMHSGRSTGGVPIIHRDVKPANIIVTDQGSVLVDFGLIRGLPHGQRLTGVVGTPGYLAPEAIGDGAYSPASDRFAFGAVAYYIVCGLEPPTGYQPEVILSVLTAVPACADHPETVEHLLAMLNGDPDQRPTGLANWIGQVRRSSLQPGPDALNPSAPRRHPSPPSQETISERDTRRRISRRGITVIAACCLAVALAIAGLVTAESVSSPPGHHSNPHNPALASVNPSATSARFLGAFDPTCGQGQFVPLPYYTSSVAIPEALGVGDAGSILAYNFGAAGPTVSQSLLYPINRDCSLNNAFYAATDSLQNMAFTVTAIAPSQDGDVYAAGSDGGGWVIVKYQPSGALDPTFGNHGYVVHPEADSGSGSPTRGRPTGIIVTTSRVFVIGVDGGSHASSRSILVSLLPDGSPDPLFNASGTKGTTVTGIGAGSGGQVMALMDNGSLLVGGSYANMGCGLFTIDEYQRSGQPAPSFRPISISGTGSACGGEPQVPGFPAAQLTSLLALPGHKFVAVGYAFALSASQGLGTLTAFAIRFDSDGSIDHTFGHNGTVVLPGLVEPSTTVGLSGPTGSMLGAVAQPNGGVVVAMVKATGIFLVYITPTGTIGGQVQLPTNSTPPSGIAVGDAGDGKIEIMTFSSAQWAVGRYVGVSSIHQGS